MANLNPGQSVVLTATATYEDASGNLFVDTAAVITYSSDDAGAFVSLVDNGTVAGVSSVKVTYVAPGTANIRAKSTDPDGGTADAGISNPDAVVCAAGITPPSSTDATAVNIVEGTPTP